MKKLKDKIAETLARREQPAPSASAPASRLHGWVGAAAVMALAAAGAYALLYFYVLTRVPNAIVGAWVVMEVSTFAGGKVDEGLKGGRLEFRRDGTMIGTVNMDGKEGKIKATVEVDGETMRITSIDPNTGKAHTDVQTIRVLDRDRLVIEDHRGTTLRMERLRE